jgi:hypothetical protein
MAKKGGSSKRDKETAAACNAGSEAVLSCFLLLFLPLLATVLWISCLAVARQRCSTGADLGLAVWMLRRHRFSNQDATMPTRASIAQRREGERWRGEWKYSTVECSVLQSSVVVDGRPVS